MQIARLSHHVRPTYCYHEDSFLPVCRSESRVCKHLPLSGKTLRTLKRQLSALSCQLSAKAQMPCPSRKTKPHHENTKELGHGPTRITQIKTFISRPLALARSRHRAHRESHCLKSTCQHFPEKPTSKLVSSLGPCCQCPKASPCDPRFARDFKRDNESLLTGFTGSLGLICLRYQG
jgi:hypothetical protein